MDKTILPGNEYYIRDASIDDIDDICELGNLLNTLNLPSDKKELESVIRHSEISFSSIEMDKAKRVFLFVLVNAKNKVIGVSQIFAKHGTKESPHNYFSVSYDERYSSTLNKYFRHQVLRLGQSFDGPTEVGSLVLLEPYRSSPIKLGTFLSFVRFLFMAMKKEYFCEHVLAELLPPLGPNFASSLWDAVGRKFTGLDYYEADMLSRNNKEFIANLFPFQPINASLLSKEAQEVIGQIGENSKGAAKLLMKIGFRYSEKVDPFDGGPHFEADTKDISIIKNTIHGRAHVLNDSVSSLEISKGMIATFHPKNDVKKRFISMISHYFYHPSSKNIFLPKNTMNILELSDNSQVSVVNFGT